MSANTPSPRHPAVTRLVATHFACVIAEWAAVIGVLVYVFDRSGTRATGVTSISMLAVALVVAPFTGWLVSRFSPQRVRLAGAVTQFVGYGVASLSAAADSPVLVTVIAATGALAAVTTLRPTGAMLLPFHARTSEQLVRSNLWVWHVENVCVLCGPLLATALLTIGGPATVLAGCAAAALCAVALTIPESLGEQGVRSRDSLDASDEHSLRSAWRALGRRPGTWSVLAVVWAQYVMIGALDLVLVVIARTKIDLGDGGPGVLTTAFGLGAFASIAVAGRVSQRPRLAPALLISVGVAGAGLVIFGTVLGLAVALIVLPLLGLARSLSDGPSRLLLQRSSDPAALGSMFAIRELCAGAGLITGSIFALVGLEIGDAQLVLVVLGGVFLIVLLVTRRGLVAADAAANVPVVEMSLLRQLPMFAPLPPTTLEAVSAAAEHVVVAPGDVVIRQGEQGDTFYAVVDGSFSIEMSGKRVRTAERLSFFGEVALLTDAPRTATVTAMSAGHLLSIDRHDFLAAITVSESARSAAWGVVSSLRLEHPVAPTTGLGATADRT